MDDLLPHNPA